MTSRWLISCVAAGLALSACSSGTDGAIQPLPEDGASTDAPEADPPEEPAPDDEPDDPFALPDEIDEEYLQSVADELIAIRSDAIRIAVRDNDPGSVSSSEEAMLRMAEATTGPALVEATDAISRISRGTNLEEIYVAPADMGDDQVRIIEVVGEEAGCAVVTATFDRSPTLLDPEDPDTVYAVVLQYDEDGDPPNPTSWKVRQDTSLVNLDTDEPLAEEEVRGVSREDLAGAVDVTCGGST